MAKTIAPKIEPTQDGFAPIRPLSPAARGGSLPTWGEDRNFLLYLGIHRSSWELTQTTDGWRLLPVPKPLRVRPGFWTKPAGKGQASPDPSFFLSKMDRAGFLVLRDNASYVYEVPGKNGVGYFLLWEKVRLYDDGAHEVIVDHEQRHAFLLQLLADKVIEAPREGVIAEMRSRLQKHKSRAKQRKDDDAATLAEARLAGFEEAVKALKPKAAA